MIPFNIPCYTGNEQKNIAQVIEKKKFCGDGEFTKRCHQWFEENFFCRKALLTTSCTHALEMAAILSDIQPGDEVILPSYTFVSTANAFVLRGARLVFVDIRPDTMNIDENLIEAAITDKTKVICVVHYAGVACEMDTIMSIANKHSLLVVEDAAQGVMSKYKDKFLGTIGHFGCYSFHETKNYTCGEGGALIINDERFIERAEIVREKGTDRSKFLRGQVDKYTWVDIGSSYLPSELNAAYLYAQLEMAETINKDRLKIWDCYYQGLKYIESIGLVTLSVLPDNCEHNGHMFYIKTGNLNERTKLIDHLKQNGVNSVFHYVPLHSSEAGIKYGRFYGEDRYTTTESERLLRLPMYWSLSELNINQICEMVRRFYGV